MLDKSLFGSRLLALREQKGFSQKVIAELLHVTRTQVSDIENGKSGTNLDRFHQLCEFYQVSADYLLGFTDDPTWRGER
ncbi:XRE family transcriptional regulator [Pseudoflavonifractor sp. 60]|uniref:helix-turn-helix domain-containing protein n=1 Tax=Pseudoflavonifractor sp. 60 TaxID=2304576 RepID=UPI00136BC978|nr:helix-turn-helix transcriptional regulator [Pseudoflavonifractor sp. 60]NBI68886.1 XRE family transcriptional regulator [Pseudoflavonifractor sp. 60]